MSDELCFTGYCDELCFTGYCAIDSYCILSRVANPVTHAVLAISFTHMQCGLRVSVLYFFSAVLSESVSTITGHYRVDAEKEMLTLKAKMLTALRKTHGPPVPKRRKLAYQVCWKGVKNIAVVSACLSDFVRVCIIT